MSLVVVDTDIVSYGFKGDTRFLDFRQHLDGGDVSPAVSFMTIAELSHWVLSRNWGGAPQTGALELPQTLYPAQC